MVHPQNSPNFPRNCIHPPLPAPTHTSFYTLPLSITPLLHSRKTSKTFPISPPSLDPNYRIPFLSVFQPPHPTSSYPPQHLQKNLQNSPTLAPPRSHFRSSLWFRITKNRDWSTGPLARPFARSLTPLTHSLAPDCSLRSRPLLRSLVCSLAHFAHSLARGTMND